MTQRTRKPTPPSPDTVVLTKAEYEDYSRRCCPYESREEFAQADEETLRRIMAGDVPEPEEGPPDWYQEEEAQRMGRLTGQAPAPVDPEPVKQLAQAVAEAKQQILEAVRAVPAKVQEALPTGPEAPPENAQDVPKGKRKKVVEIEPAQEYLSIEQAAVFTGLSPAHIRRAVTGGTLTTSNQGTKAKPLYRISLEALRKWMKDREAGALPPRRRRPQPPPPTRHP
jgi:hypothetical protein